MRKDEFQFCYTQLRCNLGARARMPIMKTKVTKTLRRTIQKCLFFIRPSPHHCFNQHTSKLTTSSVNITPCTVIHFISTKQKTIPYHHHINFVALATITLVNLQGVHICISSTKPIFYDCQYIKQHSLYVL